MKLAVSNIAWPANLRQAAWSQLRDAGLTAIEVAPTMEWPDWQITPELSTQYRQQAAEAGLQVSSLQAILFGKPEAQLFGDAPAQTAMAAHLAFCAELAAGLGAGPLVFGAPKNRLRGTLPPPQAQEQAVRFFRQIGPAYAAHGVTLCLEANPVDYGCDFMTHGSQAAAVTRAVHHPGIGLHLDTACMHLAGEDAPALIRDHAPILRHFHVSEPFLGSFQQPVCPHGEIAAALRGSGYAGWVVLEMKATATPLDDLRVAAEFLRNHYGD